MYLYIPDAFTSTIKNFIIAFLTSTWMLYFAAGIGFLDSTTTTVMRSMIIGVVPANEIGRVFCVLEFLKGTLSLVGPIIYATMYEQTVRTKPEAYLYLGIALKCVLFIVALVIYIELNKRENRQKMEKYSHKKDDKMKRSDKKQESGNTMKGEELTAIESVTPPPKYDDVATNPIIHFHHDSNQKTNEILP